MRSVFHALLIFANIAFLSGCQDVRAVSMNAGDNIRIKYSVLWGLRGMDQRIQLIVNNRLLAETTEEVWKKPYNAGGPVFVTLDKMHYYIVLFSGVYHIDLGSTTIQNICQLRGDLLNKLILLGRFGLSETRLSERGDDVTFIPADKIALELNDNASWSVMEGRCG